jgi:hypothetical protein
LIVPQKLDRTLIGIVSRLGGKARRAKNPMTFSRSSKRNNAGRRAFAAPVAQVTSR